MTQIMISHLRKAKEQYCDKSQIIYWQCFELADVLYDQLQLYTLLQQELAGMIQDDNLIEICTISLTCADQGFIGNISTILTDPLNHPQLLNLIENPYVAFSFCLAIKNKLKKDKGSESSFSLKSPNQLWGSDVKRQKLVQIADGCTLMGRLKAEAKDKESLLGQLIMMCFDKKEGQTLKRLESQYQMLKWHESILYMDLLLSSLKSTIDNNLSVQDWQWFAGMDKLRDQLLGILLVMIAIEYRGHSDGLANIFEYLIKFIKECLGAEEIGVIAKMNNIFSEIVSYIGRCEGTWTAKLFCMAHARRTFNIFSLSLAIFNEYTAPKPQLLCRSLETMRDLYLLFNRPFEKSISGVDILEICDDDNLIDFNKIAIFVPQWLLKFNYQFVFLLKQIIGNTSVTTFPLIVRPCLQIIQAIGSYAPQFKLEESEASHRQRQEAFGKFQEHLFQCMHEIVLKWLEKRHQSTDHAHLNNREQGNFNLEISIIETLAQVFSYHNAFARLEKNLLFQVVRQFCHKVIQLIPLRISLGFQSPLTKVFDFLNNIYLLLNQIDEEESLTFYLVQIYDNFLGKCCSAIYNQTFPNFTQQNEACQYFYAPIITFAERLFPKIKDKLSMGCIAILKIKLKGIFQGYEKGVYLVRLAIQTIKNIVQNNNRQFAEEKCGLMMLLLQKLPEYSASEYLLFLDAVIEQLVQQDASNFDESASFLWYYIYRNTSYTFSQFVHFLSSQVLTFLYSTPSNYVAHYAIHLIAKLCSNIREVQIKNEIIDNKANGLSIFDTSQTPLYNFIANLQVTVLNDLNNYEQRVKLFQIIGILTMKSNKDAYHIYDNLIRKNLLKRTEEGTLHYLMDVEGLLGIKIKLKSKMLILELVLRDLRQDSHILGIFTKEKLQEKDSYYTIFTNFIFKLLTSIKVETEEIERPLLTADLQLVFCHQLDILSQLYDEENYDSIGQIYHAFAGLKIQCTFPKLPQQLFKSVSMVGVVGYLFQNFHVMGQVSQLMLLYTNVFERESLPAVEGQFDMDLNEQMLDVFKLPQCLARLAEEIDLRSIDIFFNYRRVIEKIVLKLYKVSREVNSFNLTQDSLDIDHDSDYDQKSPTNARQIVQCFLKNRQYNELLKTLSKVQFYLEYIENQVEKEYEPFEELFLSEVKSCLTLAM